MSIPITHVTYDHGSGTVTSSWSVLSPGLTQWTLAAHHFFSISGFVLVLCGRLSWFLQAFDRTLISHYCLLTYLPRWPWSDGNWMLTRPSWSGLAFVNCLLNPQSLTLCYFI